MLIKRPLEVYEEKRVDSNFDAYRNVLKCLTYLVSLFVEEETKFKTNQKNINDLQRAKGVKRGKKNQEDSVNFVTTIHKLNSLLECELRFLWLKTKKVEQEFIK
jgi:hypothetical protein